MDLSSDKIVNFMFNKKQLLTNNTTSKTFSYTKGTVNLSFTLRTDIKQELKDFAELLVKSLEDVNLEIKTK